MVALFGAVGGFVALALGVSVWRYWRRISPRSAAGPTPRALARAVRDALTLRHLHASGPDCVSAEEARAPWRRWWHHATLGGFLLVTPVILFAVVGFEAPNGAAEEMRNPQRDVPRAIASSGVISMLCYLVPIFGILAVLPAEKVAGASGFLDAFKEVFIVYGGASDVVMGIAAMAFIFIVFTQASAWMIASDRVMAAAGADGAFFRYFGKFSERFGTPVRMNLLSGIVA